MAGSDPTAGKSREVESELNRRTVLQAIGTGAVASVGFAGTAGAHEVEGKPVFCGCQELCVCVEGNSGVLMAREDGAGGYEVGFVVGPDELDPYPDGDPRYSGDYCLSTDDPDVPDGMIIGLQVAGTRWVNPAPCAQPGLDAERRQLDSTHDRPVGRLDDGCSVLPCRDDSNAVDVRFEMDDRVVSLDADEDPVSEVTITGTAEFFYTGFEDDGPVGHAFITTWAQSEADLEFPDRDIARYFDVGTDTDTVRKDVAITVPLPPELGDPGPGEATEVDVLGAAFVGLERGEDPTTSESIGDWRAHDPMTLRVERARPGEDTGDIEATWEDCETVRMTGSDEGLEGIVVHAIRCFPGDGPCPDDNLGVSIEDPDLPLTIDDRHLEIDGDDVPYYIWAIELQGDVEPDRFEKPDDLDCSFEGPAEIDSCTEITEPGEYELVADLQPEDPDACLQILTGNVTLVGNGHTIDGSALSDSTDSTGILIDTSDASEDGSVELRDVRVWNWTDGVSLIQADFLTIRGVAIQDNDHAIDAESGTDFELESVLIEGNGAVADEFWEFGQVEIRDSEIRENGDGLVVYDGALDIHSSVIADNGIAGVRFSDMGPGVTITDTTVRGNTGEGITYRFASPSLRNVTLADNDGPELDQGPVSAVTASDLTIGDSPTLEITEVDDPMSVDDVERDDLPALPDSATAAGDGLDVTIDEGTFEARFAFDAADPGSVELWRYDGTGWEQVTGATVDDGSIGATLGQDGIYAPVVTE